MDRKQIGALELLDASIAQSHRLKHTLNAVVAEDPKPARAAARAIDERRAKGETSEVIGLLAGVPMTVKDTFDVDGLPASAGLKAYLGRAVGDAAAVGRARTEGAVIWGKTNVPAMAGDWQSYNPLYGTTNNPWDLQRTPGGSSGGAAAALAAGITPIEIGADLSGSLRIPASFCGVCAHKPTYGIVSQHGLVPPRASDIDMAVAGPMARTVRDLRLLLSVMAQAPIPARAPPAVLQGLKIAVWLDEPRFVLDADVRRVVEGVATDLAGEGVAVETIQSPVDADALMFAYTLRLFSVLGASAPAERRRYERLRGPAKWAVKRGAGPLSWAQGVLGYTARHVDWLEAVETTANLERIMRRLFERYEVLIAPVAPISAFPHDHRRSIFRRKLASSDGRRFGYLHLMDWIALATVCGLPATAVPIGTDANGLPVGLQIIGPRGGDSKTLAVAQAIEERLGGFRPPPMAF
jgi:amidase